MTQKVSTNSYYVFIYIIGLLKFVKLFYFVFEIAHLMFKFLQNFAFIFQETTHWLLPTDFPQSMLSHSSLGRINLCGPIQSLRFLVTSFRKVLLLLNRMKMLTSFVINYRSRHLFSQKTRILLYLVHTKYKENCRQD